MDDAEIERVRNNVMLLEKLWNIVGHPNQTDPIGTAPLDIQDIGNIFEILINDRIFDYKFIYRILNFMTELRPYRILRIFEIFQIFIIKIDELQSDAVENIICRNPAENILVQLYNAKCDFKVQLEDIYPDDKWKLAAAKDEIISNRTIPDEVYDEFVKFALKNGSVKIIRQLISNNMIKIDERFNYELINQLIYEIVLSSNQEIWGILREYIDDSKNLQLYQYSFQLHDSGSRKYFKNNCRKNSICFKNAFKAFDFLYILKEVEKNVENNYAIYYACKYNFYQLLPLLFDSGCKIINRNSNNIKHPLICAAKHDSFESFQLLVKYMAKKDDNINIVDSNVPLIHHLIQLNRNKFLEYLLNKRLLSQEDVNCHDNHYNSSLFAAIINNNEAIVDMLIDYGFSEFDMQNDIDGMTCLHFAADQSKKEIVKKLLEKGADPNLQDSARKTPIFYAAQNKNLEIIEILIRNKARYDDDLLKQLFEAAGIFQDVCNIIDIIKSGNEPISEKEEESSEHHEENQHLGDEWNRIEHENESFSDKEEESSDTQEEDQYSEIVQNILKQLLEPILEQINEQLNNQEEDQHSALVHLKQQLETILGPINEQLNNQEEDQHSKDKEIPDKTEPISEKEEESSDLQEEDQYSNDTQQVQIVSHMTMRNILDTSKFAVLIDPYEDVNGNTILMIALSLQFDKRYFLCEISEKINKPNKHGQTPLMVAIFKNDKKAVEILLRRNADINAVDDNNYTAKYLMEINNNPEIIELYNYYSIYNSFFSKLRLNIFSNDNAKKQITDNRPQQFNDLNTFIKNMAKTRNFDEAARNSIKYGIPELTEDIVKLGVKRSTIEFILASYQKDGILNDSVRRIQKYLNLHIYKDD